MSRVCLHRWAPVVSGAGTTRLFSCPFHKWRYGLDGQLLGSPFMERAADFDPMSCRLPEVRSEIVAPLGLIFVTFSEKAAPIGDRLEGVAQRLKNWHLNELVAVRPSEFCGDFNWKILIETGQECYHHFAAHQTTFEVNYPTKLTWNEESQGAWSICHSPPRDDVPDEDLTIGLPILPGLTAEERRVFDLYWIYPLTRLAVFTDRVRLQLVFPQGPAATYARNIQLVHPNVAADPELIQRCFDGYDEFASSAVREDVAIDIMQQRGARSSRARPGRLSHLEANVWHLGEYLRTKLTAN
jgi:phenylpropionate dioxygenase-like ring-hydroxylating dioxygenase large terminal subunit